MAATLTEPTDAERRDCSLLVCLACFSGPSSQMQRRTNTDGTTEFATVTEPAMSAVVDQDSRARRVVLATCRRCRGRFDLKELKRWNETERVMLPDSIRPRAAKPASR